MIATTPERHRSAEIARIREHLAGAEAAMRARPVDHLGEAQRLVRALLLDELAAYREAGVFPRNRDHDRMIPCFVDADGVRCAMAHLVELGGRPDLVAKIARERNNATIAELANEDALLAWLDAAGITVAEAARIQPSYCPEAPLADSFCHQAPHTVVQATVLVTSTYGYDWWSVGRVRVDAVFVGEGGPPGPAVGRELDMIVTRPMGLPVPAGATIYVEWWGNADAGADAIAPRQSGLAKLIDDGEGGVSWWGDHALYKQDAIRALTSKDCRGVLAEVAPSWMVLEECKPSSCNGTARSGSGLDATLVILGALLLARSLRRRSFTT